MLSFLGAYHVQELPFRQRIVRIFPGGHARMAKTRLDALKNKAFGASEYIRKHTIYIKPGQVASAERCSSFRNGHDVNIVTIPDAALIAVICEAGDWILTNHPGKENDVIKVADVRAYMEHDHGDEGLKILLRHFITGSILTTRLMHAATRLNIPAMWIVGLKRMADEAFAGGLTKYSVAIVRALADMHR
jgi:hypothetical protein